MKKFRRLLVLAAILSAAGLYSSTFVTKEMNVVLGILLLLISILSFFAFPTSVVLFIFSFLSITEVESKLTYDPSGILWKLARMIFPELELKSLTLCKMFWMTCLVLVITFMMMVGVVCGVFLLGMFVWLALNGELEWLRAWNKVYPAMIWTMKFLLPQFAALLFSIRFMDAAIKREQENMTKIYGLLAEICGVYFVVVLPIYAVMLHWQIGLSAALMKYLTVAGAIVGLAAGMGLILYVVFEFLPVYLPGDYFLKRLYKALKENYCPLVEAHVQSAE